MNASPATLWMMPVAANAPVSDRVEPTTSGLLVEPPPPSFLEQAAVVAAKAATTNTASIFVRIRVPFLGHGTVLAAIVCWRTVLSGRGAGRRDTFTHRTAPSFTSSLRRRVALR